MFDIGWGELLVIGVVALIAIGPKELPGVLRATGQWMGKIRRMASDFQDQFREAMREAEMEELKKQVDQMSNTADNFTNFDPLGTVRKEFEGMVSDQPAKSTESANGADPEVAAPSAAAESSQSPAPPEPQPDPKLEPIPGRKAGEGA